MSSERNLAARIHTFGPTGIPTDASFTSAEMTRIIELIASIGGSLGPILPESLANLEGWTWKIENRQERLMLTRGASPVSIIPSIQGEVGWLHAISVVFSDPMTVFSFICDNYTFAFSPYLFRTIGITTPNNDLLYSTVYNPASPMGPLYGLTWTPSKAWPYRSQLQVQAYHPATALTPTSQIVLFFMGRHFISDKKQFYESVLLENDRQSTGRVDVPRRAA